GIDPGRRYATFVRTPDPSGRMRLVDRAEALETFGPIYERVLPGRPGMMDRTKVWWEMRFYDPEHERDGFGPLFFAVHESGGRPDGYVLYRVKCEWHEETPAGVLAVE